MAPRSSKAPRPDRAGNPKTFTLQTSGARRQLGDTSARLSQKRAQAEPPGPCPAPALSAASFTQRHGVPAGPFCKSRGERSGTTESAGREGGRGPGAWAERRPAGYSQGDRAVGQRVRGQDLRELQAAAHHLALGGARRPAGPSGPPVVLAAQRQRRGPVAASQQREQSQRQQQRRRRASPQALGRLHAAGWAAGRGLPAERQSTGLAGRPGARADGSAARARGRPEPCGGQRARPPPRQHAPLSAAAALGVWVAAGSRPRGPLRSSTAERERRLRRPLPAAAPPRLPPPPPFLLPLLPLPPPSPPFLPSPLPFFLFLLFLLLLHLVVSCPLSARRPWLREGGWRSQASAARRVSTTPRVPGFRAGVVGPREYGNSWRGRKKVLAQTPATVATVWHASLLLLRRPPDKGALCAPGGRPYRPASPSPRLGVREESRAEFLWRKARREVVPQTNYLQRTRLPTSLPTQGSRAFSSHTLVSFVPNTGELGTGSYPGKRTLQSRFWPSAIPLITLSKNASGPRWTGSLWKKKFPSGIQRYLRCNQLEQL